MILVLAGSAMVSATVQNVGVTPSIQYVGSTIGTAMRGTLSDNVVGTVAAIFLDAHPAFILLCTSVKLRCTSMNAINYM